MSVIPDKIEVVQFVCSACGKRSVSAVVREKMKCKNCNYEYIRENGEWHSSKWLKFVKSGG